MKKKINLLITTYHLDHGGVEEVILTYAKLLDKDRYSITVGCLHKGTLSNEIDKIPGVRLVFIDTKSRIKRFFRFAMLAREVRADIVHNHSCWYGLFAGSLCGAYKVETVHNMYFWFSAIEKLNYSVYLLLANRIIAVSNYVRKFTLDFFSFIDPKKIVVVYNGIHYELFKDSKPDEQIRSQLKIEKETIVVGFVGRLTFQKGITYLLDAASIIETKNRAVKFLIVGEGELREELEAKVKSMRLGNIIFVGFQREIIKYLSIMDIFVLPSLFEGLPMSVLEAMACKKPVVATNISGTAEVVVDNQTGFLVEPKNVEQLTDRLMRLIANSSIRQQMGELGMQRVIQQFSAQRMINKTEEIYCTRKQ